MLKLLRSLVSAKVPERDHPSSASPPPLKVSAAGVDDFDVTGNLDDGNGYPILDWKVVHAWTDAITSEDERARAWGACEIAWLEHFRAALGNAYRLDYHGTAVLLSTLEPNVAKATLSFVNKTLQRVTRVLDGVANAHEWGKDILVVFDNDETYYRYVAHYYPEAGEFASSGGMFIGGGCGHFATVKTDLRSIEPIIAHELTHSCLSHLPIPAWLNEGLAVNTEHRICPPPLDTFGARQSPQQIHSRHRKFWGPSEIQEFWSGKSFLRPDEGNELSYDLARIMVSQFASDWEPFRRFVLTANVADSGASAAAEHLGVELGQVAAALLEQPSHASWAPNPPMWGGSPERGAF